MKKIVDGNVKGVEYLFKKNKITLIKGRGKLAGQGKVEVTPKQGKPFLVETACTILATGTEIKGCPASSSTASG